MFEVDVKNVMEEERREGKEDQLGFGADIWNIGEQGSGAQVTLYSVQARGDTLISF